jgi:hypothetical protein
MRTEIFLDVKPYNLVKARNKQSYSLAVPILLVGYISILKVEALCSTVNIYQIRLRDFPEDSAVRILSSKAIL